MDRERKDPAGLRFETRPGPVRWRPGAALVALVLLTHWPSV